MMKEFIYLIQGQSDLVVNFFHLRARENCDVLILTYDKKVENCVFYPNSTWAEGRNHLLELAKKKGRYTYYIFCDDDIHYVEGGYDEFEKGLLEYGPAIGIPVVSLLLHTKIKLLNNFPQAFLGNDEPLMAFHKSVVERRLVLPYETRFDGLSWWGACLVQQILIQTYYRFSVLQFNNVVIDNTAHGRYEVSGYGNRIYANIVRLWLVEKLQGRYKETCRKKPTYKLIIFTLITLYKCKFKKTNKY